MAEPPKKDMPPTAQLGSPGLAESGDLGGALLRANNR
jgi:hypothetical protein